MFTNPNFRFNIARAEDSAAETAVRNTKQKMAPPAEVRVVAAEAAMELAQHEVLRSVLADSFEEGGAGPSSSSAFIDDQDMMFDRAASLVQHSTTQPEAIVMGLQQIVPGKAKAKSKPRSESRSKDSRGGDQYVDLIEQEFMSSVDDAAQEAENAVAERQEEGVLLQIQDPEYDILPPNDVTEWHSAAYRSQFKNLEKAANDPGNYLAQNIWIFYMEGLQMHRDHEWTQRAVTNPLRTNGDFVEQRPAFEMAGVKVDTREEMSIFAKRFNKLEYIEDLMYGPDDSLMRSSTGRFKRDPETGEIKWRILANSTESGSYQKAIMKALLGEQEQGKFFHLVEWTTRQIAEILTRDDRWTFVSREQENKIYGQRLFIEPVRLPMPRRRQAYRALVAAPPGKRDGTFRKVLDATGRVVMDPDQPQYASVEKISPDMQKRKYVKSFNFLTKRFVIEKDADGNPMTVPRDYSFAVSGLITKTVHFAIVSIRLNNRHAAWRYSRELRNTNVFDTPTKTLTHPFLIAPGQKKMVGEKNDPRSLPTAVPLLTPRSTNMDVIEWKGSEEHDFDGDVGYSPADKVNTVDFLLTSKNVRPISEMEASHQVAIQLGAETMPKPLWFETNSKQSSAGKGKEDIRMLSIPKTVGRWDRPSKSSRNHVRDYSQLWSEAVARPLDACDPTVSTFPARGSKVHAFHKTAKSIRWVPEDSIQERASQFMIFHFDKHSEKTAEWTGSKHSHSRPTFPKVMMFKATAPSQVAHYMNQKNSIERIKDVLSLKDNEDEKTGWAILCERFRPEGCDDRDLAFLKMMPNSLQGLEYNYQVRISGFGSKVIESVCNEHPILIPLSIDVVIQRYVRKHDKMLQYHALHNPSSAVADPHDKLFDPDGMLSTQAHLNGPGGLLIEARVDEGNQQFKGGYDSFLPIPGSSTIKTIDLRQVRGLHEIKAFQSPEHEDPNDTRIGPPHWWKEERKAQQDLTNPLAIEAEKRTKELSEIMDAMQVPHSVGSGVEWKNDCSAQETWRASGGEQAVLQRMRSADGGRGFTAQHFASVSVTQKELRDHNVSADLGLPHTKDLADPPELLPFGRLEYKTATLVHQRMFQSMDDPVVFPAVKLQSDGQSFKAFPDTSLGKLGRSLDQSRPLRTSLATPLYVTMLDHDDLWFAETRTDRAWNNFFNDPHVQPFLTHYDKYVHRVDETTNESILILNEEYVHFADAERKVGKHATRDAPRTTDEMVEHCHKCRHLTKNKKDILALLKDASTPAVVRSSFDACPDDSSRMVAVDVAILTKESSKDRADEYMRIFEYKDQQLALVTFASVAIFNETLKAPQRNLNDALTTPQRPFTVFNDTFTVACTTRVSLSAWKCMTDASTTVRFPKCVRSIHRYPSSFNAHRAAFGGLDTNVEDFKSDVRKWCEMYKEANERMHNDDEFTDNEVNAAREFRIVKDASFRLTWFSQLLTSERAKLLEEETSVVMTAVVMRDLALEVDALRRGVSFVRSMAAKFSPNAPNGEYLSSQYSSTDQTTLFPSLKALGSAPIHWPDDSAISDNPLLVKLAEAFLTAVERLIKADHNSASGLVQRLNRQWQSQLPSPETPDASEWSQELIDQLVNLTGYTRDQDASGFADPAMANVLFKTRLRSTYSPLLHRIAFLRESQKLGLSFHLLDGANLDATLAIAEHILAIQKEQNPTLKTAIDLVLSSSGSMDDGLEMHVQAVDALSETDGASSPSWYVTHLNLTDALLQDVNREGWHFVPTENVSHDSNLSRRLTMHAAQCYMVASRIAQGQSDKEAKDAVYALKKRQGKRPASEEFLDSEDASARMFGSLSCIEQFAKIMQTLPDPTGDDDKYAQNLKTTLESVDAVLRQREQSEEASAFENFPAPIRQAWVDLQKIVEKQKKSPANNFAGIPYKLAHLSAGQQQSFSRELNAYKSEVLQIRMLQKEVSRYDALKKQGIPDEQRPAEDRVIKDKQVIPVLETIQTLILSTKQKRAALDEYVNGMLPIPVYRRQKPRTDKQVQLAKNLKRTNADMRDTLAHYGIQWKKGAFSFGDSKISEKKAKLNLELRFGIDPENYDSKRIRLATLRYEDAPDVDTVKRMREKKKKDALPPYAPTPASSSAASLTGNGSYVEGDVTDEEIMALLDDEEDSASLAVLISDGATRLAEDRSESSDSEMDIDMSNDMEEAHKAHDVAMQVMGFRAETALESEMNVLGSSLLEGVSQDDDDQKSIDDLLKAALELNAPGQTSTSVDSYLPEAGREHDLLMSFLEGEKQEHDTIPDPKLAKKELILPPDTLAQLSTKMLLFSNNVAIPLLDKMLVYYNGIVTWINDVLMFEHRRVVHMKRICTQLYLHYAKEATPTLDAFQKQLNETPFEPSPNVVLLPDAARYEMGNYFDGAEEVGDPQLLSGDELYGYKGAWIRYLRSNVEWMKTGNRETPYAFVVTSKKEKNGKAPMSIFQWLHSSLNTGTYDLPPYPFPLGPDGGYPTSFQLANYSSGEFGHVPIYSRKEVADFLHNGTGTAFAQNAPSLATNPALRNEMHTLWHRLEKPLTEEV